MARKTPQDAAVEAVAQFMQTAPLDEAQILIAILAGIVARREAVEVIPVTHEDVGA
jgi:predicted protein tyrosine phosphatase